LRLRKVKKKGVAVMKFGVNERGCNGASSGKVESVANMCPLSFNKIELYIRARTIPLSTPIPVTTIL